MNQINSASETPFSWEKTPDGIKASKESYFAWARENSFASPDASEPSDYLFAVSCNIGDQSCAGNIIDVNASQGTELVYRSTGRDPMSQEQSEALAKRVLGIQ